MKSREQNEKYFWDKAAKTYDNSSRFDTAYKLSIEKCNSILTGKENVLDIACGTGIISLGIAENANHVTGLDLSEEMIQVAVQKTPPSLAYKISFEVGDGYNTGFVSESFDMILIFNALHIVKEPDTILKEAYRILRKGGYLITATDCYNESVNFRNKIYHVLPKFVHKAGVIKYLNNYKHEDIYRLLIQNNFHITETELLFDKPTNYFAIAKKS